MAATRRFLPLSLVIGAAILTFGADGNEPCVGVREEAVRDSAGLADGGKVASHKRWRMGAVVRRPSGASTARRVSSQFGVEAPKHELIVHD